MSKVVELSKCEARRLILQAQGLSGHAPFGKGKLAVVEALRRLGYVQIDTISVVERAHHHVLWSRVPDYQPAWLHDLQVRDRAVLEYWSHAAAYLPIESYRYCLPRMAAMRKGAAHWFERDMDVMKNVLKRIKKEGPLLARDFEAPEGARSGNWFEWKPAKKALERLFQEGRVMIVERRGFQKVYDLTERALPTVIDKTPPTKGEYARYLIRSALTAHGIASVGEIAYLRKRETVDRVKAMLSAMVRSGEVMTMRIEDVPECYYALAGMAERLDAKTPEPRVRILSPFDNMVIQRKKLERFFGFSYQIECYVPEAKRRYGYFSLPVLYGDRFIGRLDTKAERGEKTLRTRALYLEHGVKPDDRCLSELASALRAYAKFNRCDRVTVDRTDPKGLRRLLERQLTAAENL